MRLFLKAVTVWPLGLVLFGPVTITAALPGQRESNPADQHEHPGMMKPADDASYVQMMQMHHLHGIEMAKLAENKAQGEEVKAFARRVIDAQQKDLDELKRMEQSTKTASDGKDMHRSMMEAESTKMMNKLQSATGPAFDTTFIDMMIAHHQQAIEMSSPPTRYKSADVQAFAHKAVDMQRKEVQELRRLRGKR